MPRCASRSARWVSVTCLVVLALVGALAAPVTASATGRVRGEVLGAAVNQVRLTLFTHNWTYLGTRRVSDGIFSLSLSPGTYRLQFTDKRPSYDVRRFAPRDVTVTVHGGRTVTKNVRMVRGASIVGRVRTKAGPGKRARVVAANTAGNSFSTIADSKGNYAIGGLPASSYSLFTYDPRKAWVGRSMWVPNVRTGRMYQRTVTLRTRAGKLLIDLYAGSRPVRSRATVTIVSRATGQFYTARSSNGSVTFAGVYPGAYRIEAGAAGEWLPASGPLKNVRVRAARASFGSFSYTRHGPIVTGTLVDAEDTDETLKGARVRLLDQNRRRLAETRTKADGTFRLSGAFGGQRGAILVIEGNPDQGGWMQAKNFCPYITLTLTGLAVDVDRTLAVGVQGMQRRTGPGVPKLCAPATPEPQ